MRVTDSLILDSVKHVSHVSSPAIPDFLKNKELIVGLLIEFNVAWICFCIFIAYLCVKFPGARKFLKESSQNGDNVSQHEDGTKVIIWGSAIGFFWVLVNTILLSLVYGPDTGWGLVIGGESAVFLGLLGLKKLT